MLGKSPKTRDEAFVMQLRGYRLSTVEIIYRLPDHPHLLQSFVWQHYDLAPDYPKLHSFLEFWRKNIEGAIHSVRMASVELIKPAEVRMTNGVFHLH